MQVELIDLQLAHEELYEQIPSLPFKCIEGCKDCCGFVVCSDYERSLQPDVEESKAVYCAFWDNSCTIYENRPMMCRLFGTNKGMKCQHFDYTPEMSEQQMVNLIKQYGKLMHTPPQLAKGSSMWQELVNSKVK